MDTRQRLATLCRSAGYDRATIALIGAAAVPARQAEQAMSPDQLRQVLDAVEMLIQGGYDAATIGISVAAHRAATPTGWQDPFWLEVVSRTRRAYSVAGLAPKLADAYHVAGAATVAPYST
jgi:hypothetical protein